MLKKAIMSGIVFIAILLAGCNGEQEVVVLDDSKNGENDANLSSDSNFLSELQNEIIASIKEETELGKSMAIMLGGNTVHGMTVSVSFPKNAKFNDAVIQQIVKDAVLKVSATENVAISEKEITLKIEKF